MSTIPDDFYRKLKHGAHLASNSQRDDPNNKIVTPRIDRHSRWKTFWLFSCEKRKLSLRYVDIDVDPCTKYVIKVLASEDYQVLIQPAVPDNCPQKSKLCEIHFSGETGGFQGLLFRGPSQGQHLEFCSQPKSSEVDLICLCQGWLHSPVHLKDLNQSKWSMNFHEIQNLINP